MRQLDLKLKVKKFIESLPNKHQRQVKNAILALQENPLPHDSKKLIGYEPYRRVDIGEYRIIYRYDEVEENIMVVLVGKRNDDAVYRIAERTLK